MRKRVVFPAPLPPMTPTTPTTPIPKSKAMWFHLLPLLQMVFLNFHHFWDLHPMFGQLLGKSGKIHSRKKQKNNWHGNAHIYLPPGGRLKFRLSTRRRPLKPFRKACASTTTFPRRGPGGRNIDSSRSVFWYSLAFWRSSSYARSRAWDNYTELKSLKKNRTALDVNTKSWFCGSSDGLSLRNMLQKISNITVQGGECCIIFHTLPFFCWPFAFDRIHSSSRLMVRCNAVCCLSSTSIRLAFPASHQNHTTPF